MSTVAFFRRGSPLSDKERVRQWLTMARQWHLVDAAGQDLDNLGLNIARHLVGILFRADVVPTERVRQWLTMARQWHLVDAAGQDLDNLGLNIARHLVGILFRADVVPTERVRQWLTMARQWHLVDAAGQDLDNLGLNIARHLVGILFRADVVPTERVRQWLTMARQWHLVDAAGQDLDNLGLNIARHLVGMHKPLYHPLSDVGDHVVVVNCAEVAMRAFDWRRRDYHYNRGYARSKALIPAYEIHQTDPCRLMFLSVYNALAKTGHKRVRVSIVERVHLFPALEVPHLIKSNVADQMEQIQTVPRRLEEYSEEERSSFPRLVSLPPDFPSNEEELQKHDPPSES